MQEIKPSTGFAISDEIFQREIAMCRELCGKNGGKCNWGKCESCGVIPLLYKLGKGELLEKAEGVENARRIALDSKK